MHITVTGKYSMQYYSDNTLYHDIKDICIDYLRGIFDGFSHFYCNKRLVSCLNLKKICGPFVRYVRVCS